MQIDQEQKLSRLNKVGEDNVKVSNQLNDKVNNNYMKISTMSEKMEAFERKGIEQNENVSQNIKEININYEMNNKEIGNLNNNVEEINKAIQKWNKRNQKWS